MALLDHVRPICVIHGRKEKIVEACLNSTLKKTGLYTFRWNRPYACIIFSDLNSDEGLGKPTSNPHQIKEGRGELLLHGRSIVMVRLFIFLPLNEGT